MNHLIRSKREELAQLCVRHRVSRLEVFGSAARETFDPTTSDLDFLVQFESMAPAKHADCFFGLHHDLEALFGRAVDLVELDPIQNPYFLEAINHTRTQVYAA